MKSKSSYLLAGAVALAVAGWMLSGDLFGKADGTASQDSASTTSVTAAPAVTTESELPENGYWCRLSRSRINQSPALFAQAVSARPNLK